MISMVLILGVVAALLMVQTVCLLSAFFLLPRYLARLHAEIRDEITGAVHGFITPPDDNSPSLLATIADNIILLFLGRAEQKIETKMRGSAGAAARDGNKEALTEAMAENPTGAIVGMLAGKIFGKKWGNILASNPQFLSQIKIPGFGGKSSGNGATEYTGRKHRD